MLGTAVMLAITLPMMLSVVAYFNIKDKKVPFFPTAFLITLKHGFFRLWDLLLRLAVLWHKYTGTIQVSLISALLIIGLIAGLVSIPVNLSKHKSCVINENSKN